MQKTEHFCDICGEPTGSSYLSPVKLMFGVAYHGGVAFPEVCSACRTELLESVNKLITKMQNTER
jgi:hypothetical protein